MIISAQGACITPIRWDLPGDNLARAVAVLIVKSANINHQIYFILPPAIPGLSGKFLFCWCLVSRLLSLLGWPSRHPQQAQHRDHERFAFSSLISPVVTCMLPECIFGQAVIESLKFVIFRDFEVMQLLDLPVLIWNCDMMFGMDPEKY